MIDIHAHKTDLEKIPGIIKAMLDVEVAIFDRNSRLLTATQEYFRQKGHRVHAPSIREVLADGDVLVNKPGHMPACDGCRFIGNCPAKIELLSRFGKDAAPLGVMALTSFTSRGHERITRDTHTYVNALRLFSDWIADLISDREKTRTRAESREIITTLMEMSGEAMLFIDPRGMVVRGNSLALKRFAFCDICTQSAFHILPEPLVNKILEGAQVKGVKVRISGQDFFLSARPVHVQDGFTGAVLTLSGHPGSPKSQDQRSNAPDRIRPGRPMLSNILGNSPGITQIKTTAARIAGSASTLLITGKTGTGKGLLAQAVHYSGPRKNRPFVPVNCASIPDTLFESELFGYEEGAFTGAKKGGKPGKFERAHKGTLFLDEIGEMPFHLQTKLLNVLQDQAFQRVGGVDFIPVDVRVIAATNQDLETLMREKKFRSDLYYRLNVIPMDLPPLGQRKEDISILAQAFLKTANARAGRSDRSIKGISPEVLTLFKGHDWPGNVRELQNIIEYCVNLAQGPVIQTGDLPRQFLDRAAPGRPERRPEHADDIRHQAAMVQARAIRDCLDRYGRDMAGKKKTARKLGISLRTLYRKISVMKISP